MPQKPDSEKIEMKQTIIKLDNVHKDYRMGDSIVQAVAGINLEI